MRPSQSLSSMNNIVVPSGFHSSQVYGLEFLWLTECHTTIRGVVLFLATSHLTL